MFLAIDVGNTQTTLGLFDEDGRFAHGWRMSTTAADTSDMLHSRLWGFFMKDGLDLGDVTDAGVASVVPALERACELAHEAGYSRINVMSAVGTREYYRRLGFVDNGLYQQRRLL